MTQPLRLTADQVATLLQISRSQVHVLVSRGALTARREPASRKLWFLREDVEEYVTGMPVYAVRDVGARTRTYEVQPTPVLSRKRKSAI